jgi:hypothetical protein
MSPKNAIAHTHLARRETFIESSNFSFGAGATLSATVK